MNNCKEDYSVAIACIALLVISLVVIGGVAWAVN